MAIFNKFESLTRYEIGTVMKGVQEEIRDAFNDSFPPCDGKSTFLEINNILAPHI